MLSAVLPARHRQARWTLAYSTARHGMSLNTLMRRAQGRRPCVMVVKDMQGHVFGCYTSEAWHKHHRYYGDGETFVFQLHPRPRAFLWDRESPQLNQFFQLGSEDAIALGGGSGFALRVDGDLKWGSSRESTTFANPSLSGTEDFMVEGLELWGLSGAG